MGMKMAMLVYNEAVEEEVMEVMAECGVSNYTKIAGVHGKGASSGAHLGTDVWPGQNNLLYVACSQEQAEGLASGIGALREKIRHEGVKIFIMPLDKAV
ncbi:MAG: hypothetical protein GX598_06260 [Elusimicrobia bacterium]|nr:hypothetical protein [Elusimicrobiota bacterium]